MRRVLMGGTGLLFLLISGVAIVQGILFAEPEPPFVVDRELYARTEVTIPVIDYKPALSDLITPTPEPASPAQLTVTPFTGDTQTHVVSTGENLYRIALNYGVDIDQLAALNGINNTTQIFVGQELQIPAGGLIVTPPEPIAITATPLTVADAVLTPTLADDGILIYTATPYPPAPAHVNDIPRDQFVILSVARQAQVRDIYARGQSLGRDSNAFSKIGDSVILPPHFMDRFDTGDYNLGDYAYLQDTIDYFSGSFARRSVAVRKGMHTWSLFDPWWSDKSFCNAGEHAVACEIRLHNPAFMIVRLGSNDRGVPGSVESNLRRLIEFCIENGVVPIMGTKADRFEGGDNINNRIITELAAEFNLPLWDFDRLAATIPGRGLLPDGVHMTTWYAHDWTQAQAFTTGHGVHSLTGLIVLDELRRLVTDDAPTG